MSEDGAQLPLCNAGLPVETPSIALDFTKPRTRQRQPLALIAR
jgi:hypothetical protein